MAEAADIKVLSANGVKAIMVDLAQKFESSTGNKVTLSFGEAGEIKTLGASFDVSALPLTVLEDLAKQNRILSSSMVFERLTSAVADRPDEPLVNLGNFYERGRGDAL